MNLNPEEIRTRPVTLRITPHLLHWSPVLAGACIGVMLRSLVFSGRPGSPYASMMASFIYLTPIVVGAVTVYLAESMSRRSRAYDVGAAILANVLCVLAAWRLMVEDWIGAMVFMPLFATFGALGGLIMGAVCRQTRWAAHTVYSLTALPLIMGPLEARLPLPTHVITLERSTLIKAPPEVVRRRLVNSPWIESDAVAGAWIYRLGATPPRVSASPSRERGQTLEENLHVERRLIEWKPNRYVDWVYRYRGDSFTAAAGGERTSASGHSFDIREGGFILTPRGSETELAIRIQCRLSTRFNWYASAVVRMAIDDLELRILDFHRTAFDHDSLSIRGETPG